MKSFLAAAAIAILAGAGPASAQMVQPPNRAAPPFYVAGTPSWMQDDGSSSDHPIHNPGDVSGERLNTEYRNGISVPPGQGFPVPPGQR